MPAKDGFILTPADIADYLRHVYLLRLATIDHLAALAERSYTRTQKRAAKLEARGYLDALTRPPRKTFYALGKEGIAALVEAGHAPEELLEKRPRHKELKDLFLDHLLMVKDAQVKLMLLTRGTPLRILTWIEGEELYDSVTIHENGKAVKIPVRPDAFFILQDTSRPEGQNRISFMLEADRSTESHERMKTKIKGYVNHYQQGLHTKKYGVKFYRVLTVTKNDDRARNLSTSMRDILPAALRPHYPFTGIEALTLDTLIPKPTPAATA